MIFLKPQKINPVFYERTRDGEVFYDVESRLIKDRVLFLSEPITQDVAGTVASLLFMLNHENEEEKIQLWINSPGGDAYGFLAIYDMMQMITAPVETTCVGMAMSAAADLMAAGAKGKRLATPNSRFMIHELQAGMPPGTATEVSISAENIKRMNRDIAEIFARHTGQTLEKVMSDCVHDKYLTAQEALEYGIIDKILPVSKPTPKLLLENSLSSTKKKASKKTKKT